MKTKDFKTPEELLTPEEKAAVDYLAQLVHLYGEIELGKIVNKFDDELRGEFAYMATPQYKKFLKAVTKKRKAPTTEEEEETPAVELTPRTMVDLTGPSSSPPAPVSDIPALAVEVPPAASTEATVVTSSRGSLSNAVFLETGELWNAGATKSFRAALKPPSHLIGHEPLSPKAKAALKEAHLGALRSASLVQAFEELHSKYELLYSSAASTEAKLGELAKEKSVWEAAVTERSSLEEELRLLKESNAKLEEDYTSVKEKLAAEEEGRRQDGEAMEKKDEVIQEQETLIRRLKSELAEAEAAVGNAVLEAFENATCQARVLNPGLITEGMDVSCGVKDGAILPSSP